MIDALIRLLTLAAALGLVTLVVSTVARLTPQSLRRRAPGRETRS